MSSDSDQELRFRVRTDQAGERLDRLVAAAAGVSRRVARTWIATGRVLVGKKPLRILTRPMRPGAEIRVCATATARRGTAPAERAAGEGAPAIRRDTAPLHVLFVDRYLLVVDKPAGLLTERDRFGSPAVETLAPRILAERGERDRVWLVHRLDAGTSGVLVLARTPMAAQRLGEAFRAGTVEKEYLALCAGCFEGERVVDAPIGRAARTRHAVTAAGKPARTRFIGLAASDWASLVRAVPATGRTHQIRVHLTHLGHPLLGDGLYAGPMYTPSSEAAPIGRPMLHAARLRIPHPKTGEPTTFETPPPADFRSLLRRLHLAAGLDEETFDEET